MPTPFPVSADVDAMLQSADNAAILSSIGAIGGDISAASAGSVLVATGTGNNAQATGVVIDVSNNVTTAGYINCTSGGVYIGLADGRNIFPGSVLTSVLGATISDAATNTVVTPLTLTHATSSTAAAGLGVAVDFQLPSSAGNNRVAAKILSSWSSAVDGAESSVIKLQAMEGGVLGTGVIISGSSNNLDLNGGILIAGNSFLNYGHSDVQYLRGIVHIGANDVVLSSPNAGELRVRLADDSAFAALTFLIPTSNPGPGTLWNNSGVLTIGT